MTKLHQHPYHIDKMPNEEWHMRDETCDDCLVLELTLSINLTERDVEILLARAIVEDNPDAERLNRLRLKKLQEKKEEISARIRSRKC